MRLPQPRNRLPNPPLLRTRMILMSALLHMPLIFLAHLLTLAAFPTSPSQVVRTSSVFVNMLALPMWTENPIPSNATVSLDRTSLLVLILG